MGWLGSARIATHAGPLSVNHSAAARQEAASRSVVAADVMNVNTRPSAGIVGDHEEGLLWAGNPRLASEMEASIDHPALVSLAVDSETIIYFGKESTVLGAVTVADGLRPTSAAALDALRKSGIRRNVMMAGDRRPVALRIGGGLGLRPEEIHADMLPEDKVRMVATLAASGKVAFVGDGVNADPATREGRSDARKTSGRSVSARPRQAYRRKISRPF